MLVVNLSSFKGREGAGRFGGEGVKLRSFRNDSSVPVSCYRFADTVCAWVVAMILLSAGETKLRCNFR